MDERRRDEPVKIPLDPEIASRAVRRVDPDSEPVEDDVPQELKDEAANEAEYPADETDEG